MRCARRLLAAALTLCLAVLPVRAEFMSVTSEKVNIRSAPGSGSPVVTDAWKRTPFKVLERKGNWVRVEGWDIKAGWVHKSVLAPVPAVIVRSKQANLRSEPGTGPIVWRVEQGYPLEVVEKKGNWIRVGDEEDTLGWIHKSLVWGEGAEGGRSAKGKKGKSKAKPKAAKEEPPPEEKPPPEEQPEEPPAAEAPAEEGAEPSEAAVGGEGGAEAGPEEGAESEPGGEGVEKPEAPPQTDRPKLKKAHH